MKKIALVLTTLIAVLLISPSGRAETPDLSPELWVSALSSTEKYVPGLNPVKGDFESISIEGLRGEWVSFQILIRTPETVEGINIYANELVKVNQTAARIPEEAFVFYREIFNDVREPSGNGWSVTNHRRDPGLYPDPLVPLKDPYGGGPVSLAAPFALGPDMDFAVVWVDLLIPRDAAPGRYIGMVNVYSEDHVPIDIGINLEVWELDMPAERNVATSYGFCEGCIRDYHGGKDVPQAQEGYDKIVRNYYKALHDHRIDVTTTRGPVTFEFDGDGNLLPVDWTAYDAHMQPRIDGTYFDDIAGIARFDAGMFAPGHGTGGWTDDQYKAAAKAYVEHLNEKGWLDRMWTYSTDEPWLNGGEETWNRVIREAGLLHDSSPLWDGHVLVTSPMYPGAEEAVDIWCPVNPMYDKWFWFDMDYAGRGDYDEHLANNGELWFYNCNANFPPYPGYDIDTTIGHEPRILKWGSWFEKATGFLHWNLNIWYYLDPWTEWQTRDVFGEIWARNGDGMLIYPGDNNGYHVDGGGNPVPTTVPEGIHIDGPVLSYRMKQIRDGLEDWEVLIMAEKAGLTDWVRNEMGRIYTRFGDFMTEDCTQDYFYCPAKGEPWALDGKVLEDVRRRIIAKLLFTMYPDRYPDPDAVVIPEVVEEPLADVVAPDAPDTAATADTSATDTGATDGEGHEERGGCSASGGNSRSGAMPLVAVFSIFLLAIGISRTRRNVTDSRRGQIE